MLTFICSQASETMGAVIAKTLESELDFCHAGLIRVAVPIVRDGNMIGQVFACGLASDEEEIDISLLASQFSVSEDEVREMVKSIPVGSEKAVERETAELYAKINAVDGER
jgi:ligand-binding sensor protein